MPDFLPPHVGTMTIVLEVKADDPPVFPPMWEFQLQDRVQEITVSTKTSPICFRCRERGHVGSDPPCPKYPKNQKEKKLLPNKLVEVEGAPRTWYIVDPMYDGWVFDENLEEPEWVWHFTDKEPTTKKPDIFPLADSGWQKKATGKETDNPAKIRAVPINDSRVILEEKTRENLIWDLDLLDQTVLDALPLVLRRELEHAYEERERGGSSSGRGRALPAGGNRRGGPHAVGRPIVGEYTHPRRGRPPAAGPGGRTRRLPPRFSSASVAEQARALVRSMRGTGAASSERIDGRVPVQTRASVSLQDQESGGSTLPTRRSEQPGSGGGTVARDPLGMMNRAPTRQMVESRSDGKDQPPVPLPENSNPNSSKDNPIGQSIATPRQDEIQQNAMSDGGTAGKAAHVHEDSGSDGLVVTRSNSNTDNRQVGVGGGMNLGMNLRSEEKRPQLKVQGGREGGTTNMLPEAASSDSSDLHRHLRKPLIGKDQQEGVNSVGPDGSGGGASSDRQADASSNYQAEQRHKAGEGTGGVLASGYRMDQRPAFSPLSMSQVDKHVLAELPTPIRMEVVHGIAPHRDWTNAANRSMLPKAASSDPSDLHGCLRQPVSGSDRQDGVNTAGHDNTARGSSSDHQVDTASTDYQAERSHKTGEVAADVSTPNRQMDQRPSFSPLSMSQVDKHVLAELPTPIRMEVVHGIVPHRDRRNATNHHGRERVLPSDSRIEKTNVTPNSRHARVEDSSSGMDRRSAFSPLSMSQVDQSVLAELPTPVRTDVMRNLSLHRVGRREGSPQAEGRIRNPPSPPSVPCHTGGRDNPLRGVEGKPGSEGISERGETIAEALEHVDLWEGTTTPKWMQLCRSGLRSLQLMMTAVETGFPHHPWRNGLQLAREIQGSNPHESGISLSKLLKQLVLAPPSVPVVPELDSNDEDGERRTQLPVDSGRSRTECKDYHPDRTAAGGQEAAAVAAAAGDMSADAIGVYTRLIIDFVQAIVKEDLEEIQSVMQFLHRLGTKWEFWRKVELQATPVVQAVVSEEYGGALALPM
ncbi:hypothetical protein CBR_g29920 [Chara braunii]|uniref:Uncharacterized protein n=1 Tax=Chara braunii TaxID=69332 RepID=A0A388JX50_CHABU|nr:hypothetical protein CBR_g29920 [Chara braunii]|eukprot:GBG62312.1 hypothetical protein CBR_g29920 [Chara braunii]